MSPEPSELKNSESYLRRIRNIGTIAHIDAGKTTFTERALYYAQRIHRIGEVHEGTATMDYLAQEQERGITIASAFTSLQWRDNRVNIIDTPGHVDFTIEVERSLRVLDGAIGIFCAVNGVEAQSETVWRQSEEYQVPKLAVVNKMDRVGADFVSAVKDLRLKLGISPMVLQIPEGEGADFSGIIDLLGLRLLQFDPASYGQRIFVQELSPGQMERALPWREELLETLAEDDDTVLERYLAGEGIPGEELKDLIRLRTLSLRGVPLLLCSALKNTGVQSVLDAVCDFLPSPLEVPRMEGVNPEGEKKTTFPVSSRAPLSALVFKVSFEGGRALALMRVYSGTLRVNEQVYNSGKRTTHRVARLFSLHAGSKERIEKAYAGEIVAAAGLKGVSTGDTLCRQEDPIILERIGQYNPVISLALEPRNSEEEEKLLQALEKLTQEDPTLFMERDKDTQQILLSGMGELHLEVALDRLRREYRADFRAGKPQVVCRETVLRRASAEEIFHRTLGETPHYGHVALQVGPRGRDLHSQVVWAMDTVGWTREWVEEVEKSLGDGLQSGVLQGAPVQGVLVEVLGMGEHHEHSSAAGYYMAAAWALRKALSNASPALMEPVMNVEIFVPEEFVGEVVSLLGIKEGKIEGMYERGGGQMIHALAPLRNLFGFSTEFRSASQGRGSFLLRFYRFDVVHG